MSNDKPQSSVPAPAAATISSKLNKPAYERLIAEDLAWLQKQPRTLERDHVELIVQQSIGVYYPKRPVYATEEVVSTLDELLEKARHHVMTDEEKQAQRESWVRGEWALGEYERGMTTSFPPKRPVTPQEAATAVEELQSTAVNSNDQVGVFPVPEVQLAAPELNWHDAVIEAVTPQAEPGQCSCTSEHAPHTWGDRKQGDGE